MMMYNPTDLNKTIANWKGSNEDKLRIKEFSSMPDMPMLVTHIKFVINDKYDVELESYILDIEYIDDDIKPNIYEEVSFLCKYNDEKGSIEEGWIPSEIGNRIKSLFFEYHLQHCYLVM